MSENTREITLEEAKKLYTSSEEAKAFLLSKFTKDELEGKPIPTQEEFNKFFEENIFPLIDYSKTKFLDSNFDISKIGIAHSVCRSKTKNAMEFEYRNIFVANTFTTEKEMREYFNLAKEFGYKIFTLVVENRHGNSNVHNVPTETLEKMKNRFNVKL